VICDLEHPREPLAHAGDGVPEKLAGESVERSRVAIVPGASDDDLVPLALDLQPRGEGDGAPALRSLDLDGLGGDGDRHPRRDLDRQSPDS
jgi:hypothetical protein